MTEAERTRIHGVADRMGLSLSDLIRQGIARMEADYANGSDSTRQ